MKPTNTPHTMAQHRQEYPQPTLFNLLHKWNLSESEIDALVIYKLKAITAERLAHLLTTGSGTIFFGTNSYIPIYQNVSRMTIKQDATKQPNTKYWLSLRLTSTKEAVVLIQKDTSSAASAKIGRN